MKLHDHPSLILPGFRFEIVYVLEGEAIHVTENTETPIRPSDCIFVDNGVRHGYKLTSSKPLTVMEFTFEYPLVDDIPSRFQTLGEIAKHHMIIDTPEIIKPIERLIFHDGDGRIKRLFDSISAEHENTLPGYRSMIKYKVLEIILEGLRSYFGKEQKRNYSPPIKKIVDYMNYGYMSNIPLSDFAKNLNVPLRSLSKLFIKEVGETYTKYVQGKKISASCKLLIESHESIEFISEYAGFSDSKRFRRKFKETVGMTPREYRKTYGVQKQ